MGAAYLKFFPAVINVILSASLTSYTSAPAAHGGRVKEAENVQNSDKCAAD